MSLLSSKKSVKQDIKLDDYIGNKIITFKSIAENNKTLISLTLIGLGYYISKIYFLV